MNSFEVLNRHTNLHQNLLLEASAGTGKTFSIENIVSRLLIEVVEDVLPPTIDKILIVTFTKAATRDLKTRVRSNLNNTLTALNAASKGIILENLPDYILAVIENGKDSIHKAKQRIENALFCFSDAQIFTIHSFCSRALREFPLEADVGLDLAQMGNGIKKSDLMKIIHNYFLTGVTSQKFSPNQLSLLTKKNKDNKLEKDILNEVNKKLFIHPTQPFSHYFELFRKAIKEIKDTYKLDSAKLYEDFLSQAENFNNIKKQKGPTKAEAKDIILRFTQLFEKTELTPDDFDLLIEDGLLWVDALNPELKKKKEIAFQHYPDITDTFREKLYDIVQNARSEAGIFANMAHDAQKMIDHYLEQEEKFTQTDLLLMMNKAILNDSFIQKVRSKYSAAIIDEFQDTDPIQWDIFNTLFLNGKSFKGHLYLVGDPKQSIYAFRQADIYTYKKAKDLIDSPGQFSLDTNYRSQPSLVSALNTLFNTDNAAGLITLPKINEVLEYQIVNASKQIQNRIFKDDRGSIHFMIAELPKGKGTAFEEFEKQFYFPFIADEILRLNKLDGVSFNEFAILIKDRFQENRLTQYLKERGIPYISERSESLADSPARNAIVEIIKGTIRSRDNSSFKTALGGQLIGFSSEKIASLNESSYEQLLLKFHSLRTELLEGGFSQFFKSFLTSSWNEDGKSVVECLLERNDGEDFYDDLQQIGEILIDYQSRTHTSPDGLIAYLDDFDLLKLNDDEQLKSQQDPQKEGLYIQTIHKSKGLEYGIVFALGLATRRNPNDNLFPVEINNKIELKPLLNENDPDVIRYYHEQDAEKIRQLYVAMTRAKHRLYVPVPILLNESSKLPIGSASPMDLFLSRFARPENDPEDPYDRIHGYDGHLLTNFIDQFGIEKHLSYSKLQDTFFSTACFEGTKEVNLISPIIPSLPFKPIYIRSFSSISSLMDQHVEQIDIPPDPLRLPAGAETGTIIHSVFENIPFHIVKELEHYSQLISTIDPLLKSTSLAQWSPSIAMLIYNSLNTPIYTNQESFRLCDIPPEKMRHEIEFLYPYNGHLDIEEIKQSTGFIQGVIDLVFEHNGLYYILDWKSNWLGDSPDDYSKSHLENAMKNHSYFLQAKIYTEALKRYLQTIDSRPFEECFGGVFYLFVRGIDINGNGVIYFN